MVPNAVKRERILALDLLRGYFLCVILIDHVYLFPNLLDIFTGRGELWASAAEGFFIISGLLVGYIYGPRMTVKPVATTLKLWRRAATLFIVSGLLTLLFVAWGNFLQPTHPVKTGLWYDPPILELVYRVFTFQYTYGWADFLNHYVIFMVFAPLAVFLCTRGHVRIVAVLSALLWVFRGQNFNLAWQLLFMGGICVGYYLPQIEAYFSRISDRRSESLRNGLLLLTVLTMCTSVLLVHGTSFLTRRPEVLGRAPHMIVEQVSLFHYMNEQFKPWYDKNTLGPMRIIFAAIWFIGGYVFFRHYEKRLNRLTKGVLKTLGEASLFVYVTHAVLLFGIYIYLPKPDMLVRNAGITAAFIAAVYGIARYRARLLPAVSVRTKAVPPEHRAARQK